jgi:hypothetical protein
MLPGNVKLDERSPMATIFSPPWLPHAHGTRGQIFSHDLSFARSPGVNKQKKNNRLW